MKTATTPSVVRMVRSEALALICGQTVRPEPLGRGPKPRTEIARLIHQPAAGVGADDVVGRSALTRSGEVDRLLHLGELEIDELRKLIEIGQPASEPSSPLAVAVPRSPESISDLERRETVRDTCRRG